MTRRPGLGLAFGLLSGLRDAAPQAGKRPPGLRLCLLESLYWYDEDDSAAGAHFHRLGGVDALRKGQRLRWHELRSGLTCVPDDCQDAIDVVGFDAGEDRGVAASEEAPGAADLGRGVSALDQLLDEGVRVRVGRYDDEKLLARLLQRLLLRQRGSLELFFLFAVPLHALAQDAPSLAARLRGDQKTKADTEGDAED
jgi:hypothetical protein